MDSFQFDESRIHFSEKGTGPAVLFLHAFPLCASMWNRQLSGLKDRFRVIALDLPGLGKSSIADLSSMGGFAQCAIALLDELHLDTTAIVGLSMGGYVALELWSRAPQRVSALVLCDTRANTDSPDSQKARELMARAVEEEGCQVLAERMLPNLLSSTAKPSLRQEVERLILNNPSPGAAAALRAIAKRQDFTSRLGKIACPTLVLTGALDILTPPSEMHSLAQAIPQAKYETIPGAGHLSNLENPHQFNSVLRLFLEGVDF